MATTDKALGFSDEQAVTVSAKSTKTIDLGPKTWAGNAMGKPGAVAILITIEEAFTAGGAGTLSVAIRSSDNSDMSAATTHFTTPVAALAALAIGALPFPGLFIPYNAKRYVDLYYTVATGPMTAGKISAFGGVAHPDVMT